MTRLSVDVLSLVAAVVTGLELTVRVDQSVTNLAYAEVVEVVLDVAAETYHNI